MDPPFKPSFPENLMHKNRLHEYAQKSAIPLPVYSCVNEGAPHAPKFRSTVLIDGETYTSFRTFSNRKAAEHDVAKVAYEHIQKKTKESCPIILEETIVCKSVLNEFAVKINLEKPIYKTTQSEGQNPGFISSLLFNGKSYTGCAAKSKKEAEQLAARTVIQYFLGNPVYETLLSGIIKSKVRVFGMMHKVKESGTSTSASIVQLPTTIGQSQGHNSNAPVINQLHHEFRKPKQEQLSETSAALTGNVNDRPLGSSVAGPTGSGYESAYVQPPAIGCTSQNMADNTSIGTKRKKSKKGKNAGQKKLCEGSQIAGLPQNQAQSCSVTL